MTTFAPNEDQAAALTAVVEWFNGGGEEFVLSGLAGTGKTAMLPWVVERLTGANPVFVAPTWKAADVLTRNLRDRIGDPTLQCTSVHSLIYQPVEKSKHGKKCEWRITAKCSCDLKNVQHVAGCSKATTGTCDRMCFDGGHHENECGWWTPARRCTKDCQLEFITKEEVTDDFNLVVVDEASMVDEDMHTDLRKLGVPILFVGDHGQLPPVRGNYSVFTAGLPGASLEKIMRQGEGSAIIGVSRIVREKTNYMADLRMTVDGQEVRLCKQGDPTTGYRLDREMHADGRAIFVTPTNRRKAELNAKVRRQLGRPAGMPVVGDRVMALQNDKDAKIYNGQIGTLIRVSEGKTDRFNNLLVSVDVEMDYTGRVVTHTLDVANLSSDVDLRTDHKMWRYAYAITAHKSQGSQWERVVVDAVPGIGWMKDDATKWTYTAVTRAEKELVILHK